MNFPTKWMKLYSPHPSYNTVLGTEDPVSATEMTLDGTDKHRLKMDLPSNFPSFMTNKDRLDYSIKEAEKMVKDYFDKGNGKGINIYNPRKGYFENSKIDYNSYTGKYSFENEIPFKDTLMFDLLKYRQKKQTYIKGMTYDTMTGRTEVEAETLNFSFREIGQRAYPADNNAYINYLRETPPSYKREYFGEYVEPETPYGLSPVMRYVQERKALDPFLYPSAPKNKRAELRKNLTVIIKSRARPIRNIPKNEQMAIETLREMISEAEFRKYMAHGFILVKSKSGYVYQIFRNQAHTKVWKNGQLIKEVCVRIKDSKIPPTDNVIAFKILIEGSEEEFEKLGNVYKMAA